MRSAQMSYCYYLVKLLDLFDTIFFVQKAFIGAMVANNNNHKYKKYYLIIRKSAATILYLLDNPIGGL